MATAGNAQRYREHNMSNEDEFPPNQRRLRRNDVVMERNGDMITMYGRVWRRADEKHVIVIDCGKHITLYHEDELVLTDYKGKWEWQRHPGNEAGNKPKWRPMTSLRKLKAMAKDYNASFGGRNYRGRSWTKAERKEALANPERYMPRGEN